MILYLLITPTLFAESHASSRPNSKTLFPTFLQVGTRHKIAVTYSHVRVVAQANAHGKVAPQPTRHGQAFEHSASALCIHIKFITIHEKEKNEEYT